MAIASAKRGLLLLPLYVTCKFQSVYLWIEASSPFVSLPTEFLNSSFSKLIALLYLILLRYTFISTIQVIQYTFLFPVTALLLPLVSLLYSKCPLDFCVIFSYKQWIGSISMHVVDLFQKQAWPSGPRCYVQVVVCSHAWVRVPPLAFLLFLFLGCLSFIYFFMYIY